MPGLHARQPRQHRRWASAPNPKFAHIVLQDPLRTSGSKGALDHRVASVPLIPKFASEVAARVCELRNRDTRRRRREPQEGNCMLPLRAARRILAALLLVLGSGAPA